jgi:hypothetical protein
VPGQVPGQVPTAPSVGQRAVGRVRASSMSGSKTWLLGSRRCFGWRCRRARTC